MSAMCYAKQTSLFYLWLQQAQSACIVTQPSCFGWLELAHISGWLSMGRIFCWGCKFPRGIHR